MTPEGHSVLDVVLSERNLLSLLSKLYTGGSRCEIQQGDVPTPFVLLRLRAEPDQVHYNSATRKGAPPGAMHPVTERVLSAIQQTLAEVGLEDIRATDADGERSG